MQGRRFCCRHFILSHSCSSGRTASDTESDPDPLGRGERRRECSRPFDGAGAENSTAPLALPFGVAHNSQLRQTILTSTQHKHGSGLSAGTIRARRQIRRPFTRRPFKDTCTIAHQPRVPAIEMHRGLLAQTVTSSWPRTK